MGRLLDGVWIKNDLGADAEGRFVRRATSFRGVVTKDGSSAFPVERDRYHLYAAHACPWSHRALIFRALNGLENVITVSLAEPVMGEDGWTFAEGADAVGGHRFAHEIYTAAMADYTGRASVPVLWDKKTNSIVTNDSNDIARSLDAFAEESLFPRAEEEAITKMIAENYEPIQNGVYKCGFAASQAAYDEAATALFARLDVLESLLGRQRYLLGDKRTAADWFLFPTLYRFDVAYYVHFKCSRNQLRDMPNLWGYCRELYQVPKVAETCNMDETRRHYFLSHESIHPRRYIPIGPSPDFTAPHGRGIFDGTRLR